MNASMIATIAVIIFLVIFLVIGFYKGFLRVVLTTFSLIITLVLASMLTQPLENYVENNTVIGPRVKTQIENYVSENMESLTAGVSNVENNFIDSLPVTESMKSDLKSGNTMANYVDEGVSNFAEYIAVNLTTLILKILCYVVLFIVIFIVIRLILRLSRIINHIPILGGVNRIVGAVFGLAEGVLFLWLISMAIMMLSSTEFGINCQKVIADSEFLTFVYENNYLVSIVDIIVGVFKK